MKPLKLIKRTFEAKKFPQGSPDRKFLNEHIETSEYQTSHKYGLVGDHFSSGFRSKKEAEAFMNKFF